MHAPNIIRFDTHERIGKLTAYEVKVIGEAFALMLRLFRDDSGVSVNQKTAVENQSRTIMKKLHDMFDRKYGAIRIATPGDKISLSDAELIGAACAMFVRVTTENRILSPFDQKTVNKACMRIVTKFTRAFGAKYAGHVVG